MEPGVTSSPGFRVCCEHPACSSSKAKAHHLLQTLSPPDCPTSAKGTNLITQTMKCQTLANQVSVPENIYFHNSRISPFFSISTAKFQPSLHLTCTLSSFPFPPSLLFLSPYDPAIPCCQPALCLLRNLSEPSPPFAVCRFECSLSTLLD